MAAARLTALLVLAAATLGPASAAWARDPTGTAALPLERCRLEGLAGEAWCGRLARPLDPQRADSPSLSLRVAVIPAVARLQRSDPVLFIAGGPGQSAVDLAGPVSGLLSRVLNRRDIVLVDQRGTGGSQRLECEDDRRAPASQPLAVELDRERRFARLAACRDLLSAGPLGDLRQYTTDRAVDDLEAVRVALGVPQWNVVAVSYGTRVALELMRRHAATVRRAVLDGVVAPDFSLVDSGGVDAQRALDAVWAACEGEPRCRQRFPAVRARWQGLLADLPRQVEVAHPKTGAVESLRLDRDAVLAMVRGALYTPALAAALPHAISEAAEGRLAPLVGLAAAQDLGQGQAAVASGMHFSVLCSEDVGDAPVPAAPTPMTAADADGRDFANSLAATYRQVCADWPRGVAPAAARQVLAAAMPVLALSGGADPVTPPRHAQRVVDALGPRARHAVVPQAGHGVLAVACLRQTAQRFIELDDESQALALPLDCAAGVPRPPMFVPPR